MVQIHPDPPFIGGVAQLGERMLCKHEVIGSIPFTSTNDFAARNHEGEAKGSGPDSRHREGPRGGIDAKNI